MYFSAKFRYKRRIIVCIFRQCYKIPLSYSIFRLIKKEEQNSLLAADDPIWNRYSVPFRTKGFVGYSKFFQSSKGFDCAYIREWILKQLDTIKTSDEIVNILDAKSVSSLSCLSINKKDLKDIITILSGTKIPLSSEHGDFHEKNIIMSGNGFKVIDFASYKINGSLLFDWINFEVFLYRKNVRKSYEQVLTDGVVLDAIKSRLDQMSLPYRIILFFYVVRRTLNEIDEWLVDGYGCMPIRIKNRYYKIIMSSLAYMQKNQDLKVGENN
jgi:hypothetical protein